MKDHLKMQDGTPISTQQQWHDARRPELLRLFEQNIYGKTPIGRPQSLKFENLEVKENALGGRATRLRIGVLFEGTEAGRQMELLVYLPNDIEGPVPVFLGLNFDGNYLTTTEVDVPLPTHYVNGAYQDSLAHRASETQRGSQAAMFPYQEILERGYGIATACYGEVEPDMPGQWWHGPRALGPQPKNGDDWGTIGAWAWALSRAMDYLETNPRVDAKKVAVFGFSRLGKAAMWAGAQDERFAAVISQNSGKAGVSLMKRGQGEPVSHLSGSNLGHWFVPNFAKFSDNEAALPVDGDDLVALVAPRPLLILSAIQDTWSDPEGEFLAGLSASPVYQFLGKDGLKADKWPTPGDLVTSTLGYYLRNGGHNVTPEDWAATLDWADINWAQKG